MFAGCLDKHHDFNAVEYRSILTLGLVPGVVQLSSWPVQLATLSDMQTCIFLSDYRCWSRLTWTPAISASWKKRICGRNIILRALSGILNTPLIPGRCASSETQSGRLTNLIGPEHRYLKMSPLERYATKSRDNGAASHAELVKQSIYSQLSELHREAE